MRAARAERVSEALREAKGARERSDSSAPQLRHELFVDVQAAGGVELDPKDKEANEKTWP